MKNLSLYSLIGLAVYSILGHASGNKIEQDDKSNGLAEKSTLVTNTDSEQEYARAMQAEWRQNFIEATDSIVSANPQTDPRTSFNRMSVSERPHPELFQLYFRNSEEEAFKLVKDSSTTPFRIIKVYSSTIEPNSNYTTVSPVPNPHETYSHTKTQKAAERGSIPTKKSISYPEGCNTYYYRMTSEYELRLDRGHGTDDYDTIPHPGIISTKDPDNFVPQNVKYNSPIRKCLVDELRQQGLNYHEISLYHKNCNYNVRYRKDAKNFHSKLPIPEGFIFLAHNSEGQIVRSYYFPNFINYEELNLCVPYLESCRLFELGDLQEWLWNPSVTLGSIEDHLEKGELAQILVDKLLRLIPTFFQNLTENQMPPKARVALFSTLLEWNIQSAASLEFIGFNRQLKLAYFYTAPRVFYELDDRYESDKISAVRVFLNDNTISEEARGLVAFLSNPRIPFLYLQKTLNDLIKIIETTKQSSLDYWENAQTYLDHPILYDFFSAHTDDLKEVIFKDLIHRFSLSRFNPNTDLQKLLALKGGFEVRDLDKANLVLGIVESRAQKTATSIREKLHLMRLYYDVHLFPNKAKMEMWEQALVGQATEPKRLSLLDYRRMADFYGTRGIEDKKKIWLDQLVHTLEKNPSISNFKLIAEWCFKSTGAFLQVKEEAQDTQALRASTQLALQILFGLGTLDTSIQDEAIEAAESLNILKEFSRNYQLFLKDKKKYSLLAPFIDSENATAKALIRIAGIFEDTLSAPLRGDSCRIINEEVSSHDIEEMYNQALKYRNGEVENYLKDSEQTLEIALNKFNTLAELGHIKSIHNKAMIHYKLKHYGAAYIWFKKAADLGFLPSFNNLNLMRQKAKEFDIESLIKYMDTCHSQSKFIQNKGNNSENDIRFQGSDNSLGHSQVLSQDKKIEDEEKPLQNVTSNKIFINDRDILLRKIIIEGDGDCGYHALGISRQEASEMLLSGLDEENIRNLIAPEIEDHFMTFPEKMKENREYKELIKDQENADKALAISVHEARKALEHNGHHVSTLIPEALLQYMIKLENPADNLINAQIKLNNSHHEQNVFKEKKKAYCRKKEVIEAYIQYFISVPPLRFSEANPELDLNYIVFSPDKEENDQYRTSAGDALAHILRKNLVIINLEGKIIHEYKNEGPFETLYLIQESITHYNKGEVI